MTMRTLLTAGTCLAMLGLCAFLGGGTDKAPGKVRIRLVEAGSGKAVGGMVRIKDADSGKVQPLPGLLDRMRGFKIPENNKGWHVVPVEGGETTLPRRRLRLEALHGLESALVQKD